MCVVPWKNSLAGKKYVCLWLIEDASLSALYKTKETFKVNMCCGVRQLMVGMDRTSESSRSSRHFLLPELAVCFAS